MLKEILDLVQKDLIKSAAHITGGGLVENLLRSVPDGLSIQIDLSKINTKNILLVEIKKYFRGGKCLKHSIVE